MLQGSDMREKMATAAEIDKIIDFLEQIYPGSTDESSRAILARTPITCSTCFNRYYGGSRTPCFVGETFETCKGKYWCPFYRCMGGRLWNNVPREIGYVLNFMCYEHCLHYCPCARMDVLMERITGKRYFRRPLTEQDKQFLGIQRGAIEVQKTIPKPRKKKEAPVVSNPPTAAVQEEAAPDPFDAAIDLAIKDGFIREESSGQPGVCRVCGCTDDHACITPESGIPCSWLEPDLCSACATFTCARSSDVCPHCKVMDALAPREPSYPSCISCEMLRWTVKSAVQEPEAEEAEPVQDVTPVEEAPTIQEPKPEKKTRAKKAAPAVEKQPEKETPPAATEVQYVATGDPLTDAVAKVKAEMAGAYSKAIGNFLLQNLDAHPEDAGKILPKDKTIKGALGEMKRAAEKTRVDGCGYISDAEGFAIVAKYFGIDESPPRPAWQIQMVKAVAPAPTQEAAAPAPPVQEAKKPAFDVNLDDLL
jgi:hypothetical protein